MYGEEAQSTVLTEKTGIDVWLIMSLTRDEPNRKKILVAVIDKVF